MADDPESVILVILRRLDQRTERMGEDIHDLKVRLTHVEGGLAGVNRRMDRLDQRVERIERRLDLVEPSH